MFILIVKDPYRFPPERTVWIEASNRFSAGCVSSNLLRCVFARTFQDYPILPWSVKLKRFSPLPLWFCTNFRLAPAGADRNSANLSNINREQSSRRVADHPAWSFFRTRRIAPQLLSFYGLFGMALRLVERPASLSHFHLQVSEPAAKLPCSLRRFLI
jgi:hypothetical protein